MKILFPNTAHETQTKAMWECFWYVFHGQSRLETFRRIVALGVNKRTAAEMIQDCEKEG